jgi:S1-C subfamily serine protease
MRKGIGFGLVVLVAGVGCAQAAQAAVRGPRGARVIFAVGGGPGPGSGAAHGSQGYLGVDVRDVSGDQMSALKLKDPHGAEITLVDHDGPAGKAGLREHDVVLQLNGQAIQGVDQIRRMLRESPPGKTVVLLISRDGQQMTVTAQMANWDEVERQAWQRHLTMPEPSYTPAPSESDYQPDPVPQAAPPVHGGNSFMGRMLLLNPSYTGAMLEMMSKQLADFFGAPNGAGLLVRSVAPNSPAEVAGMRAGDVVVRANSQTVASTKDWTKAIEASKGRPVTVVVMRDKKQTTLILTPDGKKRSKVEMPGIGAAPSAFSE